MCVTFTRWLHNEHVGVDIVTRVKYAPLHLVFPEQSTLYILRTNLLSKYKFLSQTNLTV